MSFSNVTKSELARVTALKPCCQLAELAALIKTDGSIQISGNKLSLHVISETAAVARKVFKYLKTLFGVHTDILIRRKYRLKKNNVYLVRLTQQPAVDKILDTVGIVDLKVGMVSGTKKTLIKKDCCRRAYLRGIFLGSGSVNNPEGEYHLEIVSSDEDFSKDVCDILGRYELHARINKRKNWDVIYLKGSEDIIKLLNLMGAHNALLNFESARVYKDVRNQVNRIVNCETANLSKTVSAAMKQVEDIRLIDAKVGLNKLITSLRKIAELRLKHPDISLKELGEMMDPPIGKSGVNHRIRRIQKMADEYRANNKITN